MPRTGVPPTSLLKKGLRPLLSVQTSEGQVNLLVGRTGVEPARPYGHGNLNPTRIPIPPPAHTIPTRPADSAHVRTGRSPFDRKELCWGSATSARLDYTWSDNKFQSKPIKNARGEIWTLTTLRSHGPEPCLSTIPALGLEFIFLLFLYLYTKKQYLKIYLPHKSR